MKGPPKQALNVASGSLTPRSVPATLAVQPDRKWYMAWSGVKGGDRGEDAEGSAVSMTMCRG